jgi:hypothetical protein
MNLSASQSYKSMMSDIEDVKVLDKHNDDLGLKFAWNNE